MIRIKDTAFVPTAGATATMIGDRVTIRGMKPAWLNGDYIVTDVTKPIAKSKGRPRRYKTDAEQQRAYRERKHTEASVVFGNFTTCAETDEMEADHGETDK